MAAAAGAAHAAWTAALSALSELEAMRSRGHREQEFLRWQLEELRNANLRLGEDAELAASVLLSATPRGWPSSDTSR